VHEVLQLTSQLFFDWQSKVTPLGGGLALPSWPSPPRAHVPPFEQVHVLPLHEHAPVQARSPGPSEAPLHAVSGTNWTTRRVMLAESLIIDGTSLSDSDVRACERNVSRALLLTAMPFGRRPACGGTSELVKLSACVGPPAAGPQRL
jgi:hypothetical protein